MLLLKALKLLVAPKPTWVELRDSNPSTASVLLTHTLPLALIPPLAAYYGAVHVGFTLGLGDPVRVTADSALGIVLAYFVAIVVATIMVGRVIVWMSRTYGASASIGQCMMLASLTATPLFLCGAIQAYPVPWVSLVVGLPVLAWAMYIFFNGIPIVMQISEERAFLFGCAVGAFGLVALVGMLAATALLWGYDVLPQFVH